MSIMTELFAGYALIRDSVNGGTLKITHTLDPSVELREDDLNPLVEILNCIHESIMCKELKLTLVGTNEIHLDCTDRLSLYGKVRLENSILYNPSIKNSDIRDTEIRVTNKVILLHNGAYVLPQY